MIILKRAYKLIRYNKIQIEYLNKNMDIQYSKPPVPQNKSNNKFPIDQTQLKILKLKIQVMQIVCATFYNHQHRCLLSYVSACTLQKQVIKGQDLSIFQNYQSLIVDLTHGYFLTPYESIQKKQKRDKKIICYKLNIHGFFKLIKQILTDLQAKLKKIKEFYLQNQKNPGKQGQQKTVYKRCKNCHTKQNVHLQLFGFDVCQKCKGNQFQEVVINERQKQKQKLRIDKLNDIIMIVFAKLKQIRDLQMGLQVQIDQIQQKKQVKVSQIDQFMAPLLQHLKKQEKVQLKPDFKTIKISQKLQAPLVEYQRVKQMEARQRSREKGHQNNTAKIR